MNKIDIDIAFWNKALKHKSPDEIITWALTLTPNRIVTTSFGKYSAILLSTISRHDKDMRTIWCDTLFNQPSTYSHASSLISQFNLKVHKYQPLLSKAEIDATLGLPTLEDEKHAEFSEVVKLEPFRRALEEQQPDLWFTNIRIRQTEIRSKKDILSLSKDGILKVSPFYYWTDEDLDQYLATHNLPKNVDYFDPIKALKNRECGIHLQ